MSILIICPCCSNQLLHHFGKHREYWFCRQCWQEMPDIDRITHQRDKPFNKILNLSTHLVRQKVPV
ncbi:MAG: hypothetical protein ACFCAD_00420 [Pleurocapsa sp.]